MAPMPRKKGPPAFLRIDTPPQMPQIALAVGETSASALSPAASESDYSPSNNPGKPRSLRNMKKLSLTLSSAQSSSTSLVIASEPQSAASSIHPEPSLGERRRRPSIISLPPAPTKAASAALLHRKEQEGDPAVPYADGPVQIIPSVWLGSEENARDWNGLMERGIRSILNVAKEVMSPFDTTVGHLRSTLSTPNLQLAKGKDTTYYPPNPAAGRPAMHYLKLQWSHGQNDLVENGFQAAMAFTDAAIERGEGVLIHCQCGISRSATMVIALVMRAAAERSPSVPSEIWALKGMQGAYTFVKEKSKWVGPNMSLIYQLLEYEKKLDGDRSPSASEKSSMADEEEEWGRRRRLMDEEPSDPEDEREIDLVMQEAKALDKAMEDRFVARKASASSVSISSMSSNGVGMGPAWRSRFMPRKRTGSIASNMTNGSILSEDLVEVDEEGELLGIGGGFDSGSAESELTSATNSQDDDSPESAADHSTFAAPFTAKPSLPPPSAPVWRTSFAIAPPPASAMRATFDIPPRPPVKAPKRRPMGLGILPPVPSSPIQIVIDSDSQDEGGHIPPKHLAVPRPRTESRRPIPPPLHIRSSSMLKKVNKIPQTPSALATPSQTLFVFPPSPTLTTRTPSTMTLTHMANPVPFPSLSTPRVSTFRSQGRTRSFIGLGAPPTPTTAFSKVDVRGYVGFE